MVASNGASPIASSSSGTRSRRSLLSASTTAPKPSSRPITAASSSDRRRPVLAGGLAGAAGPRERGGLQDRRGAALCGTGRTQLVDLLQQARPRRAVVPAQARKLGLDAGDRAVQLVDRSLLPVRRDRLGERVGDLG